MEDEIKLSDYTYILKKNWLFIIGIFLIVAGSIIYYTHMQQPSYEARSLVVVPNQDKVSLILGRNVPKSDINTEIEIIKSETVLGKVQQEVASDFNIRVDPLGSSNVIEIKVEASDPTITKQIADMLAEEYVRYSIHAGKEQSLQIAEFIEQELKQNKAEIDELNIKLLEYKSEPDNENITKLYLIESIQDEIKAKENLYDYLLSRKEEVKFYSGIEGTNRQIVEYARVPTLPSKPNIPLYYALGIALGLISGFMFAFIKEFVRDTFKNINQIETDIGQVIGTIPHINKKKKGMHFSSSIKPNIFTKFFCTLKPNIFFIKSNHPFYQSTAPHSLFAENIRMLKTNLMFYMKENEVKLISITSPQKKDGKSTIASNLAMALAKNNLKVLLVDVNLRDPILGKYFKKAITNSIGLREVILDGISLNQAIKKTEEKNLDIILSGEGYNYPGELISSKRMKDLLKEIKKTDYDVALFDSPSLEYSESAFMAANCDGVILVVAQDITHKGTTIKAKNALEKVKANLIGIVVNLAE